jgi:DNA-binding SARP family transcriptional activator
MTRWSFGVLGPLLVERDGLQVRVGSTKQRALLALLALDAGRAVPTSEIVDGLWGDDPPATATKTIQMFVSRLRRDLGPGSVDVLVTQTSGYALRAARADVDLRRVEDLVTVARAADGPAGRLTAYTSALELWRGPALNDVADAPFVVSVRARLDELHAHVVEERIDADLALGREASVLAELRQLAAEHSLRERRQGQLVVALYRCGRQSEALDVIRVLRGQLRDELGLDLSPDLADLERRVLQHDPALTASGPRAVVSVPDQATDDPGDQTMVMRGASRPRGRAVLVGAAVVVVAGLAVGAALIRRDGGSPAPAASTHIIESDSVAVISASGDAVADLPVGSSPGAVAVTPGHLWVGDIGDHTISEFALPSGRLLKTYGLPDSPVSLTPLGDQVWVGNGFGGTLSRILVPDQQLTAPFFPQRPVAGLVATAASLNGLWVGLANRELLLLDPASLRPDVVVTLPERVKNMVALGSDVVTIPRTGSTIRRVSALGAARALVEVPGQPEVLCAGFRSVWVGTVAPAAVLRIDPETGRVLQTFALSGEPTGIACASSGVWVAEGAAGVVERVPGTPAMLRSLLEVGHPIRGVAADGHFVYLTVG